VAIDACTLSPFAFDSGSFVLQRITIGNRASIGLKSVVGAGQTVPDDCCMSPLSSAYELSTSTNPEYRNYCRPAFPGPPPWLKYGLGMPLKMFVGVCSAGPYLLALLGLASLKWSGKTTIEALMAWFTSDQRLLYLLFLRFAKVVCAPFFHLAAAVLIKRVIIGKFEAGPRSTTAYGRFRHWLMGEIMTVEDWKALARILGSHYEGISVVFRLFGAKIGKHVYWPGSGLAVREGGGFGGGGCCVR
jgi:hypothetical protein